jgi:predicted HTH domain antitoxin
MHTFIEVLVWRMGIQLVIPDDIVRSIRLPEGQMEHEMLKELAVALYAHGFISFGKAHELSGIGKFEFGRLLGTRGVLRHYGQEELQDDLAYAC